MVGYLGLAALLAYVVFLRTVRWYAKRGHPHREVVEFARVIRPGLGSLLSAVMRLGDSRDPPRSSGADERPAA